MNRIFTFSILILVLVQFAFPKAPKVLFPNGNEKLVVGSEINIRWENPEGIDSVEIFVDTDHPKYGKQKLAIGIAGNSYKWKVPKIITDKAKVTIRPYNTIDRSSWARSMGSAHPLGTSEVDHSANVQSDKEGNIYVAGTSGAMLFLYKYRSDGSLEWRKEFGKHWWEDYVDPDYKMLVNEAGDVYVAASFVGAVNLGGTIIGGDENYFPDIFLAKYDAEGELQWFKHYPNGNSLYAHSLALDKNGNLFLGGLSFDSLHLGTQTLVRNERFRSFGFLVKYTSEGTELFSSKLDGDISQLNVAVDSNDNIFVAGGFTSAYLYLDNRVLKGDGNYESSRAFIVKYNSKGKVDWVNKISNSGPYEGSTFNAIKIDNEGSLYLAGESVGSAYMKGRNIPEGILMIKCDTKGEVEWLKNFDFNNDYGYNHIEAYYIDKNNNIRICSQFSGTVEIDGQKISTAYNQKDILNLKINSQGKIIELTSIDLPKSSEYINAVCEDQAGNSYFTGIFYGKLIFKADTSVTSYSSNDVFLLKLGTEDLQSDVSDTTFSIVMPEVATINVDMGKQLIGQYKDSTVTELISNSGAYPFTVDSIFIAGEDATAFELPEGFVLAP